MTRPERKTPPKRAIWFQYTDASSLGIEIAVAISVGAVGGYYIERYLTHWSPWTMLLGFAVGVAAAVKAVLRTARTYQASLRRDAELAAAEAVPTAEAPEDPASDRSARKADE